MTEKKIIMEIITTFFQEPFQPSIQVERFLQQSTKHLKKFINNVIKKELIKMKVDNETEKEEYIQKLESKILQLKKIKQNKKKKKRCKLCRKKINLTATACKCGNLYCSQHFFFLEHNCIYPWKTSGQKNLEKTIIGCCATKIDKI